MHFKGVRRHGGKGRRKKTAREHLEWGKKALPAEEKKKKEKKRQFHSDFTARGKEEGQHPYSYVNQKLLKDKWGKNRNYESISVGRRRQRGKGPSSSPRMGRGKGQWREEGTR